MVLITLCWWKDIYSKEKHNYRRVKWFLLICLSFGKTSYPVFVLLERIWYLDEVVERNWEWKVCVIWRGWYCSLACIPLLSFGILHYSYLQKQVPYFAHECLKWSVNLLEVHQTCETAQNFYGTSFARKGARTSIIIG